MVNPFLYMEIKLNLEHNDGSNSKTIVDSSNFQAEIQKVVLKVHSNKEKQKIDTGSSDRVKIACPYCGDSKKFASKKRGIIYLETKTYKCWNCNIWKPLKYFFEDFGSDVAVKMEDFQIEKYLQKSTNIEMSLLDIYDIKDKLIPRKQLMFQMGLVEPIEKHVIYDMLKRRKQNPDDKRFALNPRTKDLIMFNMTQKEMVIGIQIRRHNPDKGKPRFISFSYKDILEKIYKKELDEKERMEAERVTRISLIYNILMVDLSKNINIFESTMNSNHLPNSIACWGASSLIRLDDAAYFMDDDDAGRSKAIPLLKEKRKVFLWAKFRKENPKFKDMITFNDFNDLYAKGGFDGRGIEKYLGNSKLDLPWL